MKPIRPANCSVVAGLDQGYGPLPIRHIAVELLPQEGGGHARAMETVWQPSPSEIAAIVPGHPVKVRILGRQHPPIQVLVGDTETFE